MIRARCLIAHTSPQLIDAKTEVEREKNKLELKVIELTEEKSHLNLMIESKNATIGKLQKQIYEVEKHECVCLCVSIY